MPQATGLQNADKISAQNTSEELQLQMMQTTGTQLALATVQPSDAMNRPAGKQVNFALLIPVLEQQVDKDRAMQLLGLYVRLRSNNINKEEFVRKLRSLVGDHMLKMAVYDVQQQQLTPKPSSLPADNNAQTQLLLGQQSDSHAPRASHNSSNIDAFKQPQQHNPFPQPFVPNHGNTAGNYSSPNMNMSLQPFKQLQQSSGHLQPSMHKDQRLMSSMSYVKQEPLDQINDQQHRSQMFALPGPSSISPGQINSSDDETFGMMSSRPSFSKNPTIGQKKTLDAPSSRSKKQKVSGAYSDQSIEQLHDVTVVSRLHFLEEEQDSRVSEASRKVVQEEEERLIWQKTPFQKNLDENMTKCGAKNRSDDVERCLSLVQDVRAELEKEREARKNLEDRLEQMERNRERELVEQREARQNLEARWEQTERARERELVKQREARKNLEDRLEQMERELVEREE